MATPRPARRRTAPATAQAPGDDAFHPVPAVLERRDRRAPEETVRPGPFPTGAVVWTALLTLLTYALGWYVAYNGILPIFLSSDVGLAGLLTLTLWTCARIVRSRIPADGIAIPGAALAKAAAWSLSVFWFFATLTNVLQLAIGLGLGIYAYQLFTTRSKIAREGYGHATRNGPAFAATVLVLATYVTWFFLRRVAGFVPGFEAGSLIAGVTVAIMALVMTDRRARRLVAAPYRVPAPKGASRRRSDLERRTIAGVVLGYLFFRFFISSAIPYGPIVEWFLVCVGALFIAIVIADRIGVVPTRRSLPHPDVRIHVQRILSLPDHDLAETDAKLDAFIRRGEHGDWVEARFRALFEEAAVPSAEVDTQLRIFHAPKRGRYATILTIGLEARQRLVEDLLGVLRAHRQRGATGTLKAAPSVRNEDKGVHPLITPAP